MWKRIAPRLLLSIQCGLCVLTGHHTRNSSGLLPPPAENRGVMNEVLWGQNMSRDQVSGTHCLLTIKLCPVGDYTCILCAMLRLTSFQRCKGSAKKVCHHFQRGPKFWVECTNSKDCGRRLMIIGERERANLVVRSSGIFYIIYDRSYVV